MMNLLCILTLSCVTNKVSVVPYSLARDRFQSGQIVCSQEEGLSCRDILTRLYDSDTCVNEWIEDVLPRDEWVLHHAM